MLNRLPLVSLVAVLLVACVPQSRFQPTPPGADLEARCVGACDAPAAPGVKWCGCDKRDAVLFSADLRGADLRDADLRGAALNHANLSEADLRGADLTGAKGASVMSANLSGANLSGATLRGATFTDADFTGADLSNTNLTGANLSGANLLNADLSGANLTDAELAGAEWGRDFPAILPNGEKFDASKHTPEWFKSEYDATYRPPTDSTQASSIHVPCCSRFTIKE